MNPQLVIVPGEQEHNFSNSMKVNLLHIKVKEQIQPVIKW